MDTRFEAKALPGQMRYTRTKTEFEPGTGLVLKEINLGEVTSTGADTGNDETCTSTEYARNTEYYRFFAARVQTRKGSGCAATDPLVSRAETFHDYHAGLFDAPTNGRPTMVRNYASDTEFVDTKSEYDMFGRPTKAVDAEGRISTTAYEPSGLRPTTKVTMTNPKGWQTVTAMAPWWAKPTSVVDVNGKRTDIAYDALGRTAKVWHPDQPMSANPNTPSVDYSYGVSPYTPNWTRTRTLHQATAYLDSWSYVDGFGDESETQVPAPGGGRIVTHKGYDDRGLVYWDSAPMHNSAAAGSGILNPGPNTVPSRNVYFYDTLERQTSAELWSMAAKKWETKTAHDGDRSTVTPPAGGAVTTVLDAHNRTILTRAYDGPATSTTFRDTATAYHPDGKAASVTDPAGNITRYSYDLLGRATETTDPDAGKSTATYTKTGQVASSTDARGKKLSHTYDELDRKTATFDGDGVKIASWTFDPAGAKGQASTASRHVGDRTYTSTTTGYDDRYRSLGNSITIPSQEGALAGTYTITTGYDKAGRVATSTFPAVGGLAAETVTSTYTDLGHLNTLAGSQTYVGSTSFDQLGRISARQYGQAPAPHRTYGYDESTGRLAFARAVKGGTSEILLERQYAYDNANKPTQVAEFAGTTTAPTLTARECFRHDNFAHLTTAWTTTGDCATEPASGQANGVDPYHLAWEVNSAGNRTKETNKKNGQARDYTYPAAGQARPHAVTAIGSDTFEYDVAGNATKRVIGGSTQTIDWDALGQVDKVTSGSDQTGFVYDSDGGRLIRREPGATTLYLGPMELRLPSGGQVTATRFYVHGTTTVAVRTPSGVAWQLNDRQASAELSVDANSGTVAQRRYLPYGGDRSTPASWPTDRGFLDKTADASTGLVHLGAREYDPDTGGFLSVDPLATQTRTPYSYAANNPVTFADPSGLAYEECTSGMYVCRGGTKVIKPGKRYKQFVAKYQRESAYYQSNWRRHLAEQERIKAAPLCLECIQARQEEQRLAELREEQRMQNRRDLAERASSSQSGPPKRNNGPFDFSQGYTAHVCGGYGLAAIFATGNDMCVQFDKHGGGLSTTNNKGLETDIGVQALFGVGFSNATKIEDLAGEGYYGGVTGGNGVIAGGQNSTNADQTYLSRTVGAGLGLGLSPVGINGGKSDTLVWRLWEWPSSPDRSEINDHRRYGR